MVLLLSTADCDTALAVLGVFALFSWFDTETDGVDVPQAAALATIAAESNNVNNIFFFFHSHFSTSLIIYFINLTLYICELDVNYNILYFKFVISGMKKAFSGKLCT